MKYSHKLHVALILISFAVLFAVIGSAYSQIDSVTWKQWKGDTRNVLLWPTVDSFTTIVSSPRYTKNIVFTDSSGAEVLSLRPNGDIMWRRRLVTTDSMLVQGLRDIIEGRR